MFVRKKRNKSGSQSVQVIEKKAGGYRVVKSLGAARDRQEVSRLVEMGKLFIEREEKHDWLFAQDERNNAVVLDFVKTLKNASVRVMGPELLFGKLFDEIGFGVIQERLFRDIVVARLVYPSSKLKTVDYLYRYQGKNVSEDSIYLFLDRLNKKYSMLAKEVACRHSEKILKTISVVFYDMTTLYFEAEDEDDLRKIGFSKDGKFQNPQIMLGLLVGEGGYPIGYDIFEGNTFEGHTLLPVLQGIEKTYHFGKPVVVADSAMLSQKNLDALEREKYSFIVAARLRNESLDLQKEILEKCCNLSNGQSVVFQRSSGVRLIVSYSDKRAKKDIYNREKGLRRLKKMMATGRMSKQQINNRGYNKFLKLTGEISLALDDEKILQDTRWDGLKGYITNTALSAETVIANYGNLWQIEQAFRISKTDLRIRPIFHRLRKRIEAHILIAFVAYTIFKELQRRLQLANINLSPKRVVELSKTMYQLHFNLPDDPHPQQTLLQMDSDQRLIYDLFY